MTTSEIIFLTFMVILFPFVAFFIVEAANFFKKLTKDKTFAAAEIKAYLSDEMRDLAALEAEKVDYKQWNKRASSIHAKIDSLKTDPAFIQALIQEINKYQVRQGAKNGD